MKRINTLLSEMGIKGKFVSEITERYEILLKALIEMNLPLENYGASFGKYYASIKFKNKEDKKILESFLEETNLKYIAKIKQIQISSNEEIKKQKIKKQREKNISILNATNSFDDYINILKGLKRDYPSVSDISIKSKKIYFLIEEEIMENDMELNNRIEKENKEYINFYINMSKEYDKYKKMKEIFEGYE